MRGSDAATDQATVRERWIVAALTFVALSLRAWQLQRAGLSQFDEGVYTFSALGLTDPSQPHRLFPEQQKFSPPVYFSLAALSYLLGGASDRSAIVVNVLLGAATVPALWWVARRWVGAPAAVAAAALVALSEAHILLSRAALTDVTFALVFLLALGAVAWALERADVPSAVLAGLAVGLAWNTKYHGWFALVIGAMAIAAKWRIEGIAIAALRPAIRAWVTVSVVAVACYVPWMVFIQSQSGSTSGWASYFATMLRIHWIDNLVRHARQQWLLEGVWSRLSVVVAIVVAAAIRRRKAAPSARLASVAVLGAALGAAGAAAGLTLAAIWRRRGSAASYGVWCAIGVVALWLVMAPLYQPYFRLLLPFSLATFMLAGDTIAQWLGGADEKALSPRAAGLALAVAVVIALGLPRPTSAWRPGRSLAAAADAIDRQVAPGTPVAVIGEPGLAFYLHQRGHPAFGRATLKELDSSNVPALVVAGHYARKAPTLRDGLRDRAPALEVLGRYPVVPSDLRLIDDYSPAGAQQYRLLPDTMYDLVLYRYDPARRPRAPRP